MCHFKQVSKQVTNIITWHSQQSKLQEAKNLQRNLFVFPDCDSIFKTLWEPTPDEWRNPDLAESFEHLFEIKDAFTKEIQDGVAIPFSLYLSVQPELFEKLKVIETAVRKNQKTCTSLSECHCVTALTWFPVPSRAASAGREPVVVLVAVRRAAGESSVALLASADRRAGRRGRRRGDVLSEKRRFVC